MSDTRPPPQPEESTEEVTAQRAPDPARLEAMRTQQMPTPGQKLVGRYTVLQMLGEGGMGVVLAAYDERLDRRVALKLLRRGGSEGGEQQVRLLREAQAMARLNHPNVVAVYDSGQLEDGTCFIAMEHVEGRTLRDWCEQRQRSWREVLRAFLQAGRGLAAAHAAGLVHRDFKPVNVLVGTDERVRVTDFGVARVEVSHTPHPSASGHTPHPAFALMAEVSLSPGRWETPLTLPGSVVGTPRYMAPELLKGQPADGRSDIFSFCVALYEALYAQNPFVGDSQPERLKARMEGRLVPLPARTEVPAWLGRALMRGLSASPGQRPASMYVLLALLEDDPEVRRRERLRALAFSCASVALVALGVWGGLRGQGPGCGTVGRRLEGVWDAQVRQRVRQALTGTGLSYASDTARRVEAVLEDYSGEWVRMSQEVCEAAGPRAGGARGLGALREACLERRRHQLHALTELLSAGPDPALVSKAVQAARALPALEYCADERALTSEVPPPEDAGLRATVEALHQRVDRLEALGEAGKYPEGLAQARDVLAQVRAVDFAPLRARALYEEGQLLLGAGDYKGSEARAREAILQASRGGDKLLLARAWSLLALVVGAKLSRPQEVLGLELALQSVAEQVQDAQARAALLHGMGNALAEMGRLEEALERYEGARALREKALGPEHPEVGQSLNSVSLISWRLERYEEALAHQRRALELLEKALGPEHPHTALSINNMALVLNSMGRYQQAREYGERALAVMEKALGPEHSQVALPLNNLGNALCGLGQEQEALARHQRALAIREKALGPQHPIVATSLKNLGTVLRHLGRFDESLAVSQRALALREAQGPAHPELAGPLLGLAELHLAQQRPAQAVPILERALALEPVPASGKAPLQFALARALWDSRRDRQRAREFAIEAHAQWRALKHPDQQQAAQWLASHALP